MTALAYADDAALAASDQRCCGRLEVGVTGIVIDDDVQAARSGQEIVGCPKTALIRQQQPR